MRLHLAVGDVGVKAAIDYHTFRAGQTQVRIVHELKRRGLSLPAIGELVGWPPDEVLKLVAIQVPDDGWQLVGPEAN